MRTNIYLTKILDAILKLMDVWQDPIAIKLTGQVAPQIIKMNFIAIKDSNFSFWGKYYIK